MSVCYGEKVYLAVIYIPIQKCHSIEIHWATNPLKCTKTPNSSMSTTRAIKANLKKHHRSKSPTRPIINLRWMRLSLLPTKPPLIADLATTHSPPKRSSSTMSLMRPLIGIRSAANTPIAFSLPSMLY